MIKRFFMSNKTLKNADIKYLKGIGHRLNPVVIVGGNGLTPNVIEEIGRALTDHELIKVKIPAGSKEEREETAQAIADACEATLINQIGRMCLTLRENPEANPKLSNLARFG